MDSSSDGSFAWTEASDDSTENETLKNDMNARQSSEESESGKNYKKKLQQQLFEEHNNHEITSNGAEGRSRKRRLSRLDAASPRRKRIKTEPESDVDKPQVNNNRRSSRESSIDAYDESYLDLKVKNEQSSIIEPSAKRKRKRNKDESTSNGDITDSQNTGTTINNNHAYNGHHHERDSSCAEKDENICDIISKKKKKKSKKRRKRSEGENSAQESANEGSSKAEGTAGEDHPASKNGERASAGSHVQDNGRRLSDDAPSEARPLINSGHTSDEDIQHPPKISKRIKKSTDSFDHNGDSHIQSRSAKTSSKLASGKKSKLSTFIETSAHLQPCRTNLASGSVLGDDDDVWVIRCPRDVAIEAFQDKEWSPASGRKIKLDGQAYEAIVDDKWRNLTVLSTRSGRAVIGNVSVAGCVRLRHRIPKSHIRQDAAPADRTRIPLPPTKRRHPLFGLHYKKAIRVPAAAAERLRAADERVRAADARKTRRRAPPAPPAPSALTKKKKKKKRGRSASAERAPAAWDSAKAIEDALFNF